MNFKFFEDSNLGVFATKILLKGRPVRYVYHNLDGDWQFHTAANPKEEDACVLSLAEVVRLDSSINGLFDLPLGWMSSRKSKDSEWSYSKHKE